MLLEITASVFVDNQHQVSSIQNLLGEISELRQFDQAIEPAHKLKIDQNKLQNCRSNILNLVNVL